PNILGVAKISCSWKAKTEKFSRIVEDQDYSDPIFHIYPELASDRLYSLGAETFSDSAISPTTRARRSALSARMPPFDHSIEQSPSCRLSPACTEIRPSYFAS